MKRNLIQLYKLSHHPWSLKKIKICKYFQSPYSYYVYWISTTGKDLHSCSFLVWKPSLFFLLLQSFFQCPVAVKTWCYRYHGKPSISYASWFRDRKIPHMLLVNTTWFKLGFYIPRMRLSEITREHLHIFS